MAPEPHLVHVDGATTSVIRGVVPVAELAGWEGVAIAHPG